MRIAYLECFLGISGDMLLGAMVDAGVPLEVLQQTAAALNVGARVEARKVLRGGITGTKVDVLTAENSASHGHDSHDHTHKHGDAHSHGDAHDHSHAHEHGHSQDHEHDSSHSHEHTHEPHRSLSTILGI